ncbi:MerR family transcriptional regulator [Actinokineospora bangkokensis]|uniref:HTH merR-type domain-containing protein n=1 Tax=Actinokineospora bangkokensis TaxID=1193682 RepID=A0A1Q9LGF2_9PSEU|nr:MerR family transcriptional regulator [Actinokineospora bangkokensis]OLR91029.1 hypothetical protein BJP25_31300 [Actinokineospora bangkokensis]
MEDTRWSVGALAKAAGLTVRTLHHYDEIGLVTPSERTAAGHRRYTPEDVRLLYRVRALRSLGLPLGDIAATLTDPVTLQEVLERQLAHLEAEAERLGVLRERVKSLLDGAGTPRLLETMQMIEQYYTPEQLDWLARRRAELGEERIAAAEAAWPPLIERLTRHQREGTPVTDPEVQRLAAQWSELLHAFHGGDEGIMRASQRLHEESTCEDGAAADKPALFDYVQRAWSATASTS